MRVIVDGKLRQLLECIITGQQTSNKEYWVTARWWQVEVQQTWNKEYWVTARWWQVEVQQTWNKEYWGATG